MNAPDRYERFVVPEGTKKVSYERDTKIVNAASFTVEREDHTIGNIVRMQLHRDPNVLFAGYKLPHPLQYKIVVRIHTTSHSSPTQAYNQAINDLDKELDYLKDAFEFVVNMEDEKYGNMGVISYFGNDKGFARYLQIKAEVSRVGQANQHQGY